MPAIVEAVVTAPPSTPGANLYAIAGPATGDFAGKEGLIARPSLRGSWVFEKPAISGSDIIFLASAPTAPLTYDRAREEWTAEPVRKIITTSTVAVAGRSTATLAAGRSIATLVNVFEDDRGTPTLATGDAEVVVTESSGDVLIENTGSGARDFFATFLE